MPSVSEAWRETATRFRAAKLHYGHGTHNARDEAAWLVCHVLRLPFHQLSQAAPRALTTAQLQRVRGLAERRISTRTPLAYLLGEAWLGPHRFYIDRRVIVPRSLIAELLPGAIAPWLAPARVRRALDVCTGSGCLAILAALAYPKAHVDAADISRQALLVAGRNVRAYELGGRVRVVTSDLFRALDGERYELIIANPPYVYDPGMRRLPAEYRCEPPAALSGGRDGLDLVRRILAGSPAHLTPRGLLVVELGHNRSALERAYPRLPFQWLTTSAGDELVFMLSRAELLANEERIRTRA